VAAATAAIAETAGNRKSSLSITLSIGATLIPAGRCSLLPKVKCGTSASKIHRKWFR
jgi:hypothetical protein